MSDFFLPPAAPKTVESIETMPIVVNARTGLAAKHESLMRKLPSEYGSKSIQYVLEHILDGDLSDDEAHIANSLRKEMNARGSVAFANGKQADFRRPIGEYVVELVHRLPDGTTKPYRSLEIEISAVQRGGC